MTRIRLNLSENDFEIFYNKGITNTNVDTLWRTKLDTGILKNYYIIPIKRNMTLKRDTLNFATNDQFNSQNIPEAYIWDATLLSDDKNLIKLNLETSSFSNIALLFSDTPATTFEKISIDTTGPFRYSDNFSYIMLLQDAVQSREQKLK